MTHQSVHVAIVLDSRGNEIELINLVSLSDINPA